MTAKKKAKGRTKSKAAKTKPTRGGQRVTSRDGGLRMKRYIRMSEAEWNYVKQAADLIDTEISSYVRAKLLRGMPAENPHAID